MNDDLSFHWGIDPGWRVPLTLAALMLGAVVLGVTVGGVAAWKFYHK